MRAPELPVAAPPASPGTAAMPPGGGEAPTSELGDAFEQLLEAIAQAPADAEQAEAEAPLAALVAPPPAPVEQPASLPEVALAGREDEPAPEQRPVATQPGRPAQEPPLAALARAESGEGMPAAARDAGPAPAAQPPAPAGAEQAAVPTTPEPADVVARPATELTRPPETQAGARPGGEAPEAVAAPTRSAGEDARPDTAMPDGGERRDGTGARPDGGAQRSGGEAVNSDPRTAPFELGRSEAMKQGSESETRDPRAAALRSGRSAEPAPSETAPEAPSPLPRATPLTPGPAPAEPTMVPTVRPPAAGTPAEALPMHAEWLAARGGGTARLRLHPPELGEVELSVRVRGSTVQVSIQTEQAEAGRAALDGRELLVEALASRELRVEQLVVRSPEGVTTTATPGDSGDESSEHLSGESEGSSERDESRTQAQRAGSEPEPPPEDARPAFGSAVDLRI